MQRNFLRGEIILLFCFLHEFLNFVTQCLICVLLANQMLVEGIIAFVENTQLIPKILNYPILLLKLLLMLLNLITEVIIVSIGNLFIFLSNFEAFDRVLQPSDLLH